MEGLREAIAESYQSAAPPPDDDVENLRASYKINPRYMIENQGIRDTVAFLRHTKGKSVDDVHAYISKAAEGIDWRQILNAPAPTINITVIDGDNNTVTTNAPQTPAPATFQPIQDAPDAEDNDPHRFTSGDFIKIKVKLEAHPLWADLLQMENDDLQAKRRGPINNNLVAFVALLWRKNIKQNVTDLGAVPFDVAERFIKRNQKFVKRAPCNRQLAAALSVLESVGYIKQVRKADKAGGRCAAYRLLNEDHWAAE